MSVTTRVSVTDSVFDCEACANTIERNLIAREGYRDARLTARSEVLAERLPAKSRAVSGGGVSNIIGTTHSDTLRV